MSRQASGQPTAPAAQWSVIVPVKLTAQAKTRLAGDLNPQERAELARAMVADTVAAARAAHAVRQVVVVTDDDDVVADLRGVGSPGWAPVVVVPEPVPAAGLNAAIRAGVAAARRDAEAGGIDTSGKTAAAPGEAIARGEAAAPSGDTGGVAPGVGLRAGPVAVLLGDLPALRPADLEDALAAASAFSRAVVVDAEGTGTTLLTASAGVPLDPAFGAGSAAEHVRRGHVALDVPDLSGLRQDVDRLGDLAAVAELGAGRATSQVLARRAQSGTKPPVDVERPRPPALDQMPCTDETAAVA
jgi:2-phospho-L-lactate guanylyltransferase